MSLLGFRAQNHQQQVSLRGALDDVDDRELDPRIFDDLATRFGGFTVDAAANHHNTKCDRYWTTADSGLLHSWAGERVWCNPPFSGIEPWIRKAWSEVDAALIVMLLPANRTEQRWWQEHVEPHRDHGGRLRVEFLRGRIHFLRPGQEQIGRNDRPPFGLCLLIFRQGGDA